MRFITRFAPPVLFPFRGLGFYIYKKHDISLHFVTILFSTHTRWLECEGEKRVLEEGD